MVKLIGVPIHPTLIAFWGHFLIPKIFLKYMIIKSLQIRIFVTDINLGWKATEQVIFKEVLKLSLFTPFYGTLFQAMAEFMKCVYMDCKIAGGSMTVL